MEMFNSLVLSVAANVIAYYILKAFQCIGKVMRKWFARMSKGK